MHSPITLPLMKFPLELGTLQLRPLAVHKMRSMTLFLMRLLLGPGSKYFQVGSIGPDQDGHVVAANIVVPPARRHLDQ
jgi:hypothetical protein